jgi:uncharacterized membrane protein YkvA (DUF1232 family)
MVSIRPRHLASAGMPQGFLPDCVVLVRRLLRDPRVPRARKLALGLLVAYLLFPLDLIPDFLPVIGQLDDALVAGLALRGLARGAGAPLLREHWPGGPEGLSLVLRLAGVGEPGV